MIMYWVAVCYKAHTTRSAMHLPLRSLNHSYKGDNKPPTTGCKITILNLVEFEFDFWISTTKQLQKSTKSSQAYKVGSYV